MRLLVSSQNEKPTRDYHSSPLRNILPRRFRNYRSRARIYLWCTEVHVHTWYSTGEHFPITKYDVLSVRSVEISVTFVNVTLLKAEIDTLNKEVAALIDEGENVANTTLEFESVSEWKRILSKINVVFDIPYLAFTMNARCAEEGGGGDPGKYKELLSAYSLKERSIFFIKVKLRNSDESAIHRISTTNPMMRNRL